MNLNNNLFDFLNTLPADFSVTRWRSTSLRNAAVGGAPGSKHLSGDAVDLVCDSDEALLICARFAFQKNVPGIELDMTNKHLHLDMGPRLWRTIRTASGDHPLTTILT